ncbi:hypothetical protein FRC0290_00574 [Corynebacterium diphtheriae]|nr:hypothetical protein FRC0290_00574 [Corynebacterium diphtheriae]CAB1003791.1 hypothetical protein FRC0534_00605 [Corynebacterium diphtheriae]
MVGERENGTLCRHRYLRTRQIEYFTRREQQLFREDFYIVYADSEEAAHKLVEKRAHEEETPKNAAQDSGPTVTLRHIIDVAPALYGYVDKDCNLYSRHFASLEDYARFEMMLGGKDPLSH